MQVNHPVEHEEVTALLDGELPPERAAVVAAHVEECVECRQLADELRGVSTQLAAWQVEKPAIGLWRRRSIGVWKWAAGVAAAIVLLSVFSLLKMMHQADRAKLTAMRAQQGVEAMLVEPDRPFPRAVAIPHEAVPVSKGKLPTAMPPPRPMIARTSQLVLITKTFDHARGAIEDILKRHRGYIGQLDVSAPASGPRTLAATLRIPADQLEPAIAEIKKLGKVESESQSGEEITQQYVDLDARLNNARNTEQRLTALLRDRTGKMTDVLAVENEVDRVRGEVERMEAEKKTLVNRVDFATLNITVREASAAELAPHSTLDRFSHAAADGVNGVVDSMASAVVAMLTYGLTCLLWIGLILLALRFLPPAFRKAIALLKWNA